MTDTPKRGWQQLGTKVLLDHSRLTIVEDNVSLQDGHKTKYLRFEDVQDYVVILAFQDEKIALTKEYSYPVDEWLWQLPEGTIEKGESIEFAAARELLEEAGLKANKFEEIGSHHAYHRRTAQLAHVIIASDVTEATVDERGDGDREEQGIERHWVPVAELLPMIRRGEVKQGSALAAISVYIANSATTD